MLQNNIDDSLNKLIIISSKSLINQKPKSIPNEILKYGKLGAKLFDILCLKNGFFAFESALHFFPLGNSSKNINLESWNKNSLWKERYEFIDFEFLCFAEDIFGFQFCIFQDEICNFNPETGEIKYICKSFEQFAKKILTEYDDLLGYKIAQIWQKQNGPIKINKRLFPKIPFICGGDYTLNNLYEGDSIKSILFRSYLALQIKNLPDGAEIEFEFQS